MELKTFLVITGTVFLAEIGDKTQLATLLYASDAETSKLFVLLAACLALIAAASLSVLAGAWLSHHLDAKIIRIVAGVAFIAVGAWTLVRA